MVCGGNGSSCSKQSGSFKKFRSFHDFCRPVPPAPPFSGLLFLELNAFLVTQHFLESKWETVEQTVTMQCSTC